MGFRVNRRVGLGSGFSLNLGKRGASVSKRTRRGSVNANSRGGTTGSVRIVRGISYLFGKRR